MNQTMHLPGVELLGSVTPAQTEILTAGALKFFCALQREFNPRRLALLRQRQERQAGMERGERPAFPPETQSVRAGDWRVLPVPDDLQDRRMDGMDRRCRHIYIPPFTASTWPVM